MARYLRWEKELIASHMIAVMMAVDQMADRLAAGGLLGCGDESFALQRISQRIEDQQRIFSDEKAGVGNPSIEPAGAALLLVRVDVRRELPQFRIPCGNDRIAFVDWRKRCDRRAEDARRGFVLARRYLPPKFIQAVRSDEPGSQSQPRPSGARHCFAPAKSLTLKLFFFRHDSSSNFPRQKCDFVSSFRLQTGIST